MFELIYPSEPAPLYPRPSIDRPGPSPVPADELLPLIETDGRVYGQASRAWCHSGSGVLHPVVHLHLIDRFGRLCLQKRSPHKDLLPGCWDTAVGGHVSYGEQVREALFREAAEELGLTAFHPVFIEAYPYRTERDSEFVCCFAAVGHPELRPDPAEVSECRWFTPAELDAAASDDRFTPNFREEYARIRKKLPALL